MDRIAAADSLRHRFVGMSDAVAVLDPVGHPEVLFVCPQNAGRSQMAAALLALRSSGRIHARSAGSAPAEAINPLVAHAMTDLGVDLSEAYPKPLTDEVEGCRRRHHDGLRSACPIYPGKRYEDWTSPIPARHDSWTRCAPFATRWTSGSRSSSANCSPRSRPRDHAAARSSGGAESRRVPRPRLRGAIAHELF